MFINAAGTAIGSAVIGNVVGGLFGGGGGGGSGGGNAPPVYQPKDQAGRDQNFLDMQNYYQQLLQQQYNQASPYNQQMFQSQMNNSYAGGFQQGANNASNQYGINSNYLQEARDASWQHADQSNAWGNQIMSNMQMASPYVTSAADTMRTMGDSSNRTYQGLIDQQQSIGNRVYGAANNLAQSADAIQQSAFDPQGNLYRQNLSDLTNNVRAGEYARGIQMSPAGASVEADALGRFQNDWQNQQLSRQVQGVGAMGQADQSALGLTTNYVNNIAGLQTGMNNNYSNLATNAATMLQNWDTAQANVNATNARTNATNVQTATNAGNAAADAAYQQGALPYNANQTIYNNQNTALNNYQSNNQPYYQGMNQLMSNDLGYMNRAQSAQNQGYNQNMQSQQWQNQMAQQYGGPLSSAVQNWWSGGWSPSTWVGNGDWTTGGGGYAQYAQPDYGAFF